MRAKTDQNDVRLELLYKQKKRLITSNYYILVGIILLNLPLRYGDSAQIKTNMQSNLFKVNAYNNNLFRVTAMSFHCRHKMYQTHQIYITIKIVRLPRGLRYMYKQYTCILLYIFFPNSLHISIKSIKARIPNITIYLTMPASATVLI